MRLSRSSLVVIAVLATSVTGSACSGRPAAAPPEPAADAIAVTVSTVTVSDAAGRFEAGGVVQARTTATLTARIVAPVREIRAAPGDRVRAGQLVIVLDGRDLEAQARGTRAAALAAEQEVLAADSEREAAESALALARATHARIEGLHARRSATPQELDDASGALHAAQARAAGAAARARAAASAVDAARAAGDAAATTETFSRITAPFDGLVTQQMVETGNMAGPGIPLMRLEDTRSFRLDVRVDASRAAEIAPGAAVPVVLDESPGAKGRTVDGTVTEIGRAVDADVRSFLVKIALPADSALRSGLFGRARFATRPRRTLTVPDGALVHRGQVTSVFVVEDGVARVRLVNVRGNEVLAGLADGETVIVAPPPDLRDGGRVTPGGR